MAAAASKGTAMRRSPPLIAAFSFATIAAAPAAAAGSEEVYFKITLTDATVARADSLTAAQGAQPYLSYKLDRVYVKSWSTSAGGPPPGFVGGVRVAAGDVNSAPRGGSINQLVAASIHPTGQCKVGRRFASATVEGGGKRYELRDVRIAGCKRAGSEEQITFVYGSMK